jgi:hypothetical protein
MIWLSKGMLNRSQRPLSPQQPQKCLTKIRHSVFAICFMQRPWLPDCFALARVAMTAFLTLFVVVHACLLFCPIAILFTAIVFADQRGQMLDPNTNCHKFGQPKRF